MIWLALSSGAWASPSPSHVRAVAEQPASLDELDRRQVRLWWDEAGPARIEVQRGEDWVTVVEEARPGDSAGRLHAELRVRVVVDEVPSAGLVPVWGLDPHGVARLAAPVHLAGAEVADVAPTSDGAWVALLGGGLARVDKASLEVAPFGRAEGLPSGQVNAVVVDGETTWVATGQGLARMDGERVVRVWDRKDGLPDAWVQALGVHDGVVWAGTWHGLASIEEGYVEDVMLRDHSVFALEPGNDDRMWAGSDGLRGLPQGEPIEGIEAELNVWDVEHAPGRTHVATDSAGVLLLREGVATSFWEDGSAAVYALSRVGGRLVAAANTEGLVELSESGSVVHRHGRADGLPSDTVFEVVEGPPGKAWVGTDNGLALAWLEHGVVVPWPVSPAAEGIGGSAALAIGDAVLLGGDDGLAVLGELPRRLRDASAAVGPIVGLHRLEKAVWIVGAEHAWRVERGRVESFDLPMTATGSAVASQSVWVTDGDALVRFDAGLGRFVPGPSLDHVADIAGGAVLWTASGGRVVAVDRIGETRDYARVRLPTCVAPHGGVVLVGTETGLQVLDPGSGEVTDLDGLREPIVDLAVGDMAYALLEDRVVRVPTMTPVGGAPELWTLGELRGLDVDTEGRVWVFGERGYALLPDG
ncbi:MAG: hypothetical protein GY913_29490 [Proteobacteria bacterium]|nr:hypothetical protein [Pseudomonadota bacterium]MCP4921049.1 hypothetical protein [Pseudomonadota bacterium]